MACTEVACVKPLEPGGDVRPIKRVERERLRIEPDVKVTKARAIATDGCGLVSWLERLGESRSEGWKLGTTLEGSRIEREEVSLTKPVEVVNQPAAVSSSNGR